MLLALIIFILHYYKCPPCRALLLNFELCRVTQVVLDRGIAIIRPVMIVMSTLGGS